MTPQMSANNLPIVSPQGSTLLSSGPQQLNMGPVTPQLQNQQLQMFPQQLSMPNNGQMNPPPPIRSASQSQVSQMQGGPPGPSKATAATDVQGMMQAWGDSQLQKSTNALVGKIQNYVLQNPASTSVSRVRCSLRAELIYRPHTMIPNFICSSSSPSGRGETRSPQQMHYNALVKLWAIRSWSANWLMQTGRPWPILRNSAWTLRRHRPNRRAINLLDHFLFKDTTPDHRQTLSILSHRI